LEAHILSSLTPSTQHLILIGDHLQLRPHIATYTLSVDSQPGEYFKLDRSLFERLGKIFFIFIFIFYRIQIVIILISLLLFFSG
jgi:superfamily I DNA and/or RNA helicase